MSLRRVSMLWAVAVIALAACSDDESTVAPPPAPGPSPDRYVNQATGDDSNDGSSGSPWSSISHALATADTNITIHVAPGTYDAANGETFPLTMKKGQTLLGNVASGGGGATPTRIQGQGPYALGIMAGTVLVGAEGARIAGFSIATATNPNLYSGIAVNGVTMEIHDNTMLNNTYAGIGAGAGANVDIHDNLFQSRVYALVLDGSGVVSVHDNTMEMGDYGIRAAGIDSLDVAKNVIGQSTAGVSVGAASTITIRDNTFNGPTGYSSGAVVHSGGLGIVRGNTFLTGPGVYIDTGLGVPDLGTAASPGQNDFSAIAGVALEHAGAGTVMAIGNTWANNPPQVGVDILITGGGSVVTQ